MHKLPFSLDLLRERINWVNKMQEEIEKLELLKLGGEKREFKVPASLEKKAKVIKTKKKIPNSMKKDLLQYYKFKVESN